MSRASLIITVLSAAGSLLLLFSCVSGSPLRSRKFEIPTKSSAILSDVPIAESSDYAPKQVYPVKRGAYIPSEDSAEDENELTVGELNEDSTWWEKFKNWEGWHESWKRVKDIAGATLANVLGGRILECLESDSGCPETIFIKRSSQLSDEKTLRNEQPYRLYFIQYNVVTKNTAEESPV